MITRTRRTIGRTTICAAWVSMSCAGVVFAQSSRLRASHNKPEPSRPARPPVGKHQTAPAADRSGGVAVPERSTVRGLLWVPRVAFFVPKLALEAGFLPLRGLAYAWERFELPQRFSQIFFNQAGTFGVFPVAFVDTGFGLNGGVRLVHRNMFGADEGLTLRASFGGRVEQLYSGGISTGTRLGRVSLGVTGGYERGPRYVFYGIGNRDLTPIDQLPNQVDALRDAIAAKTRYQKDLGFVKLRLGFALAPQVSAQVTSEVRMQKFKPAGGEDDAFEVFVPESLVGLLGGTSDVYTQIHLSFDNRRPANRYISEAVAARGIYVGTWLGYAKGFKRDPSKHFRYAVDLQGFIDVWRGDRMLILRLLLDGVTAELDQIPFTDLPELGGARLLRGYDFDRFRDRVHTLASAEYQYNLNSRSTAYLFVDSGRVFRSLNQFAFKDFRMGFGGGLIVHTLDSFVARMQFASSIDGGFFFNFGFDPVYAPRAAREN